MVEKNNFDKTLVYDAYLDKDTKETGLEKSVARGYVSAKR